jgi:hypothetical protein
MVDYCADVSKESASSIFRVTDSGSHGCNVSEVSVMFEIWRKSGQSEPWEGASKEQKEQHQERPLE